MADQKFQYNTPQTNYETVTSTLPKVSRVVNNRSSNLDPGNFYKEISNPVFESSMTNMSESQKESNNDENKSNQNNLNGSNDPNTINIKNNNGPETFTITHKT